MNNISANINNAINAVNSLKTGGFGSAVNLLTQNSKGFGSALRMANSVLPQGGVFASITGNVSAQFTQGSKQDWRVKLSLPPQYDKSSLMSSLVKQGGFVFPYTPQITISHSAQYEQLSPAHNNYPFPSYANSKVDTMQIQGDFYCENQDDAQLWIASVHYLRSVAKMYYGDSAYAGSPPPIVKLNGYGDYVFKDVPVIVTLFTVDLPKDVDYITTSLNNSSIGNNMGNDPLNNFVEKSLPVSGNMLQSSSTYSHVPVKSSFSVTVQPIYSRQTVREFNLDKFISGEYVFNEKKGFI